MAQKSPFAGMSLTDQTPLRPRPAGPDQRLFSQPATAEPDAESESEQSTTTPTKQPTKPRTNAARPHETTAGTVKPRHHDTTVSSWPDDWVAATARALRRPGKESATLRLTPEEKTQLRDLVYSYTRQGRRTSETELIRVAIATLLEDYRTNGQTSALARVMTALEP
ncbi:MAG TPA: hypothetical protein VKQ30_07645 [Ktedonobacterales bacterium]|nr:hypothetical protein [Ktedonobacterales bacterium]